MTYHPKPSGSAGSASTNGEGAVVGELDMANGHDRRLLVSRRWPIDPEKRPLYVKALDQALTWALEANDRRDVEGIIRVLATLEGQNQADEHLQVKLAAQARGLGDLQVRVIYEEPPALPEVE